MGARSEGFVQHAGGKTDQQRMGARGTLHV
jgi:hypothetical protein